MYVFAYYNLDIHLHMLSAGSLEGGVKREARPAIRRRVEDLEDEALTRRHVRVIDPPEMKGTCNIQCWCINTHRDIISLVTGWCGGKLHTYLEVSEWFSGHPTYTFT